MNFIEKNFALKENETSVFKELSAGLTTFFTMSYLFILSPKLMEAAGFLFEPSLTALIFFVFTGCCLCAFIANKPFAIAPFLGETAFIAYTVTGTLGCSLNVALTAVFLSGILLFLLSVTGIRFYLFKNIPENIKISFCAGLGLFFIFIALQRLNMVIFSGNALPPVPGNFLSFEVISGVVCFFLIIILSHLKINAAVLISVVLTTVAGFLSGNMPFPEHFFSLPVSPLPVFFQLDFQGIFDIKLLPVLFLIFMLVNIDTTGAVAALSYNSEKNGNDKSSMKKIMLADSISVILAPLFGITTPGTYLDSVTGINAGGKTGLTAFTVGVLFLFGLFFTPLISSIPTYAYAPALLYVGILMFGVIKKIDFNDLTEAGISLFTISVMVFTFNIGLGIMSAFVTYPLVKLLSGQKNKTNPVQWFLFLLSCIFFILYPY